MHSPPRRLRARALGLRGSPRARWRRNTPSQRRSCDRHRSARRFLEPRGEAPAAHGRVPPRRRYRRQQLLRPGDRGGLRFRGADLVPRWHGRAANASVHPEPRAPRGAGRADRRRRGRLPAAARVARGMHRRVSDTRLGDRLEGALEQRADVEGEITRGEAAQPVRRRLVRTAVWLSITAVSLYLVAPALLDTLASWRSLTELSPGWVPVMLVLQAAAI